MTKFKNLLVEKKGPALWIRLNRPEVKNAFDLKTAMEFLHALRKGLKDKKTSVIVLSGTGDVFSAGGDIKQMAVLKKRRPFFLKISSLIHTAVLEMKRSEKPVIAAIPGYAGGISLGLVMGADLRIASTKARFCAATIHLGLVANGSATWFIPRMIGWGRACEMFFLGDPVSARDALQIGLINRVVTQDQLEEETQKIAVRLSQSPKKILGRLKKILCKSLNSDLPVQLARERQAIAWSATTRDFQKNIRGFLTKRKARKDTP